MEGNFTQKLTNEKELNQAIHSLSYENAAAKDDPIHALRWIASPKQSRSNNDEEA